ncbi:MAG: hypothetical protein IPP49_09540 [Saprospiraceae bacterium]|nr:hypothetical protein [Saprospiraceae bacterium]
MIVGSSSVRDHLKPSERVLAVGYMMYYLSGRPAFRSVRASICSGDMDASSIFAPEIHTTQVLSCNFKSDSSGLYGNLS